MAFQQDGYTVTRHVCPRNCYDACGMLAYTRNGVLSKVEGDPAHGYTRGKLCAKGYSYTRRVYHPERVKYPLWQSQRGSGRWQRISWDQALEIVAEKILELQTRYRTHLALALNKYSGNFGILHYAVEGMFNSLGPTTQAVGSPCWSAGLDAHCYDFGDYQTSDPKDMVNARLIILWGVNTAWTAVHNMSYLYQARERGAKILVIDPVYTTTAKKADFYLQVKPGSDGAVALAMAKVIVQKGLHDREFIRRHTSGWSQFASYLETLNIRELANCCGQKPEILEELGELTGASKPVFIWIGFGLQRHRYGGQTVRAINALGALTGSIGVPGGGVQFAQQATWKFNFHILNPGQKALTQEKRSLNINNFAAELAAADDPPVKLLWIAGRNLLTQDANISRYHELFKNLELIVTVDHFLTPTAQQADLLLPATTHFEELDVVPSYWHHWVGINEPAIAPYFESKSDLEIAQLLSQKLNELSPGSCSFPTNLRPEQFLDQEFNNDLYASLGIKHWSELKNAPRKADIPATAWAERRFATPSGKFEFFSERAQKNGLPALPVFLAGPVPDTRFPYWLQTSHSQHGLNSQFQNLDWMLRLNPEPLVYLHPETAQKHGVCSGDLIRIYNDCGSITVKAQLSREIAPDMLLCYQGWFPGQDFCVNRLTSSLATDMGEHSTGSKGLALYDTFVNFEKI